MSGKKEYISISEYATLKGISKQAVYKSLTTKLKDYVEVVDGRKALRREVLSDLVEQQVDNNSTNVNRNSTKKVESVEAVGILEFLQEQIREKDRQIERLQESAKEKDKHIQEQSVKLAQLLEQSNRLQENNQVLIGLLGDVKPDQDDQTIINDEEVENIIDNEEVKKPEEKKGLFSRIFG